MSNFSLLHILALSDLLLSQPCLPLFFSAFAFFTFRLSFSPKYVCGCQKLARVMAFVMLVFVSFYRRGTLVCLLSFLSVYIILCLCVCLTLRWFCLLHLFNVPLTPYASASPYVALFYQVHKCQTLAVVSSSICVCFHQFSSRARRVCLTPPLCYPPLESCVCHT